jgi:ribonuclease P protein component
LKTEIKRVFNKGQRRRYGKLTFIFLPSDEQKTGFIASRNIGRAATRNRVRRILREAYRMKKEHFREKKTILYAEGLVTLDEVLQSISKFAEGR